MKAINLNREAYIEDGRRKYVMMKKDNKSICRTLCVDLPTNMQNVWNVSIVPPGHGGDLSGLPTCSLLPAPEDPRQDNEWKAFFCFLQKQNKVAEVKLENYNLYIFPPNGSSLRPATMVYRKKPSSCQYDNERNGRVGEGLKQNVTRASRILNDEKHEAQGLATETNGRPQETKNYIEIHPSYLKTLGHTHSGWIFGAIAELVDNSRDAKATKLQIKVNMIYSNTARKNIPMLSVIDDGQGMTHQKIKRMISFGHKQPEADDPDRIGRFGIGFKSGAMRLGKDALVLTQTADSRSIAFLSQTLNEGKDNLEIPIVSYRRINQFMEVDTNIQDTALSQHNLNAIKEFSPFDEYLIGEKTSHFEGKSTGTQIYIWNLDEWGSNCSCNLEWEEGISGKSSFHYGDITVRSKRTRKRSGQMNPEVQLDYSLRAYLEVMFFDPRMKIYVQDGVVKSRPLAKTLHKTVVVEDILLKKPVRLTIGRCQLEWERANCGIFLYWHGRLIEAYKRVGSMIYNGDRGRGVIGVIDVTELMNDDQGNVRVHNNKQAFQDCEEYAELEKWLGEVTDNYIDKHVDTIQLKKGSALYKPDHDWVQCFKCRKWRVLSPGFKVASLPEEWFCYMDPFNETCEIPEQKVESGVITVSEKRTRRVWEDQLPHKETTLEFDSINETTDVDVRQTSMRPQKGFMVSRNTTPKQNAGANARPTPTPKRAGRNGGRNKPRVAGHSNDITLKRRAGGGVSGSAPTNVDLRQTINRRKRELMESGSDNDTILEHCVRGDSLNTINRRRDNNIAPNRNAGGGVGPAPNIRRQFKKRGGIKNFPVTKPY